MRNLKSSSQKWQQNRRLRFLQRMRISESSMLPLRSTQADFAASKIEKNADGTTQSVTLPAIVDLAFACELFIKSELTSAGNKIQGHLLDKLYPHLTPVHRGMVEEEYESLTGRKRAQFEADLKELTRAFVNWRYIYEFKTNQHVAVHHLVTMTRSMYLAASKAHPNWLVGDDLKVVFNESSNSYERVVHFSSGYMIRAIAN